MSGSLMTMFRSPNQATQIFSQNGAFPKQRHVFLVNFLTNGFTVGQPEESMTYALKSVDRPSIQPHAEELSQYNKKRQIYTGYKIAPLKMSFYDTADCAALGMWANYTRYYFGDFSQNGPSMFNGADIYGPNFNDGAGNYGYTAFNGGSVGVNSQFFFSTITILHFYSQTYDAYTLVNPKIISFAPDELDYNESNVAVINVEFVYEALLFAPQTGQPSSEVPEFADGPFNGYPYNPPIPAMPFALNQYAYDDTLNASVNLNGLLQSFFGGGELQAGITASANYNLLSSVPGTGLGVYGNFSFGASSIAGVNFGANISGNLAIAAINNPALAATLNLEYANSNQLAYGGNLANYAPVQANIPGLAAANTQAGYLAGPGPFQAPLAQGLTASLSVGGGGVYAGAGGAVLSPTAYSLINSQSPGYAQIGYNPNTYSNGQPYGSYPSGTIPAGSPLANALDANPSSTITNGNTTYGPAYLVPKTAPSSSGPVPSSVTNPNPPIEQSSGGSF